MKTAVMRLTRRTMIGEQWHDDIRLLFRRTGRVQFLFVEVVVVRRRRHSGYASNTEVYAARRVAAAAAIRRAVLAHRK